MKPRMMSIYPLILSFFLIGLLNGCEKKLDQQQIEIEIERRVAERVAALERQAQGITGESGSEKTLLYVTIGTGGVTGVYYPTGGAIARTINKKSKEYHIRATVESTEGSIFNINAMMDEELEFGIVQSDQGYKAWNGLDDWTSKGKQTKLRSVFSLHPETVTLIAAANAGIHSCLDLKKKRVLVGAEGSGTRRNAVDALSTCGLTFQDLSLAADFKPAEGSKLIRNGGIDAYFYTVGHPNDSIKEAAKSVMKVLFIPFPDSNALLAEYPYYVAAAIPVTHYPEVLNTGDVPTFGVKATLLTSEDVLEKVVYHITKEIFDNLEAFKQLHPAFASLTQQNMLEGLSAPLHPGALKYYQEIGLR